MTSGRETTNAVTEALQAGYVAIDSAEWYANEFEVGSSILKFLASKANTAGLKRENIWFTTKLKTNSGYDATRKAIRRSIKESGLDYLDLYLLHSPYGGRAKRLECWKAVEDAIEEGKIRAGGVSNYGVKHVRTKSIFRLRNVERLTLYSWKNCSHQSQRSCLPLIRLRCILSTPGKTSHPFAKRRA